MGRVSVGDRAPEFELESDAGETIRLSEVLGDGPVVVFFYPKDETPVCTAEVCSFRDAYDDFRDAGASLIGVSSDSVESHQRFRAKHELPFHLVSDPGGKTRASWGVPKAALGLMAGRVTYVLDDAGVVQHMTKASFRADPHVREALDTVRKLARDSQI